MNIDTLRRIFPTGYLGAQRKNYAVATSTNSTELATLADDGVTWTLTAAGLAAQAANEYDADAADAVGTISSTLATVPSGTGALSVPANAQSVVYGTWTVQNTAGVTVAGTLRVYNWL